MVRINILNCIPIIIDRFYKYTENNNKILKFNFFIGSDFVTMIQIDCAVTDTKTLHIRDTHLRHHNDFKNNISSNLKQHPGIKLFL